MPGKKRIIIPKATRELVLREFNHRCAICGADQPQVHHIDQNPANNVVANLLPLCPNCHLTDQHNPTAVIDVEKLSLFRRFKDPAILLPQFEPLFARTRFLSSIQESDAPDQLEQRCDELLDFVTYLKMGGFYRDRIEKLVARPLRAVVIIIGEPPDPREEEEERQYAAAYRQQLRDARLPVLSLLAELLRYQDWT